MGPQHLFLVLMKQAYLSYFFFFFSYLGSLQDHNLIDQ